MCEGAAKRSERKNDNTNLKYLPKSDHLSDRRHRQQGDDDGKLVRVHQAARRDSSKQCDRESSLSKTNSDRARSV
jgi:hypothetical protein